MMKATGLKRGSRKKQPQANPPPDPKEERPVYVPPPMGHPQRQAPPEMAVQRRRQPSPDEQALTTKNYRLAKELSELRVRHREECKNVTRLTMENMNLASRCREAISHVAMLKQELAMHQRRAAEALALQREQTQRMASNLSAEVSRLSQSGSEDATESSPLDMDRILSANPPPPPPNPPPPKTTKVPPKVLIEQEEVLTSKGEFISDLDEDDTVAETIEETPSSTSPTREDSPLEAKTKAPEEVKSTMETVSTTGPKQSPKDEREVIPKVYSTPNRNRSHDRFTPSFENPGGEDGHGLFPQSASPKVSLSKPGHFNEEFPQDITPESISSHSRGLSVTSEKEITKSSPPSQPSSVSNPSIQQRRGIIGMNSIDAFEASFDTTFPEAFTPKDSDLLDRNERKSGTPSSTEIYNPFAPSPKRGDPIEELSPQNSAPSSPDSPVAPRKAHVANEPMLGNPRTPEEKKTPDHPWNDDLRYSTPPKEKFSYDFDSVDEPKRPEKTGSEAARARYQKALQPRTNAVTNTNRHSYPEKEEKEPLVAEARYESSSQKAGNLLKGNSPSALLKRIHQRRMNKQIHRQQSAPETVSSYGVEVPKSKLAMNRQQSAPEAMVKDISPMSVGSRSQSSAEMMHQEARALHTAANRPAIDRPTRIVHPGSERPFDEMEDEPIENGISISRSDQHRRADYQGSESSQTISSRLSALKSRRSVKQPVSYAEPPLNTKLRKGDTFFPKSEDSPKMVSPEALKS